MFNFLRMVLDLISKENKIIIFFTALWGWTCNLFLLDIKTLSWEFISRGCLGIAISGASVFFGLVIKDFYALKIKHKLFKSKHNATKSDREKAA
jgi:hypothetical protein